MELGIGALGIASHLIIELLPALYRSLYRSFHRVEPLYFALQIGLCSLVMLGPTVLMGMTFPIVTRAAGPRVMDLLLVGSPAPMERSAADVVARITDFNGGVPLDLSLSRSPTQIAEIAARPDVPVNTDDHPLLEFRVARNFRVGDVALIDHPDDGGSR